jgi:polyisoprenoid-binding protein YceI
MKTLTKVVIGIAGVVVVAVAAFLIWFYAIKKDAPPKFTNADLVTAIGTDAGQPLTDASGQWTIAGGTSTVGYRVKEVLAGLDATAAGRTNAVTGTLTIEGTNATTGEFTVDMTTFSSDSNQRDNQFDDRIMAVDQFPTSTFELTSPIQFGSIPKEGEVVTATATGDLTLHGVTKSVTFEVQATTLHGRIGVLGNIPVTFADYSIPNPSNGVAKTEDHGLLEFILVFSKG